MYVPYEKPRFVSLNRRCLLDRVVEHRVQRVESILLRSGQASDGRALPGAARIEADQVEARIELDQGRRLRLQIVDPGGTRSTWVREQRADPVRGVSRELADHRD